MKMIKSLALYLSLLIASHVLVAQDINLIARGNVGIGFDYISQDFNGIKTFFSPGGGLGVEVGMEGELQNDLFWYGTLGMTVNLDFHFEEINGETTKTSYGWNKKLLSAGANKFFPIRNDYIGAFYGGGGLDFGIPGTLRRTENNDYKGRVTYRPALGFHLEGGASLIMFDGFVLRPSIRYRYINYNPKKFSRPKYYDEKLDKANGQGIDISLTIVKKIKGGRR